MNNKTKMLITLFSIRLCFSFLLSLVVVLVSLVIDLRILLGATAGALYFGMREMVKPIKGFVKDE